MSVVAQDDRPRITVDGPADGSEFTDPSVRITGTMGVPEQVLTLNASTLGSSQGTNIGEEPWGIVFAPSKYWGDEFDGTELNTSNWRQMYTNGKVDVAKGEAYLYGDYQGYGYYFPLIRSLNAIPPATEDWEAVYRMKYINTSSYYSIALYSGITEQYDYTYYSHMGTYGYQSYGRLIYYIYSNYSYSGPFQDEGYHTYSLRYHAKDGTYSFYLDGHHKMDFYRPQYPTRFFFGATDRQYSYYNMTGAKLDYARVWTFNGDWTSSVQDLGTNVILSGIRPRWTTNAKAAASVDIRAKMSMDGVDWTPWTDLKGGELPEPVECRYIMFRADLALPFVTNPRKNITITGMELDITYPVSRFEYDHNDEGWSPLGIEENWSLHMNLSEDWNVISFRVTDTNGSSNTTRISLLLDTTPPVGTVEMMVDGNFINTRTVELALNATDTYGVTEMHVSFVRSFSEHTRHDYAERLTYELVGLDGTITIYVRYVDSHGLVSKVASDEIILDTTLPTASMNINEDAAYTGTNEVILHIECWDANGIRALVGCNDQWFSEPIDLEVGKAQVRWDLCADKDGEAWVYVSVTDMAGNQIVLEDSIEVYFPKEEGVIWIKSGEEYTNETNVLLDIDVPEDLDPLSMQISNNADFGFGQWMPVSSIVMWELQPGDGVKTVYLRFEDFRGIISLPVTDDIMLDTTPPKVSVLIDEDAEYTIDATVELTIEAEDPAGIRHLWISNGDDQSTADRSPFNGTSLWEIQHYDGWRTVHVWVSDTPGNVRHAVDSIFFATIPPTLELALPDGEVTSSSGDIPVQLDVNDLYGETQAQLALDRDPDDDDPWMDVGPGMTVGIGQLGEGEHTVRARVRNVPGHVTEVVTATFTVDRTPPIVNLLEPTDGSKVKKEGMNVMLELEVNESNSLTGLEYRVDGGEWIPFDLDDLPLRLKMPKRGAHTIEVRATDEAGQETTATSEFKLESPESGTSLWPILVLVAVVLVAVILVLFLRGRSD